jgi:hypothetical protein
MSRYEPKDLRAIFTQLESGDDDRAAITVAASLIEYALELTIASRLRVPANKKEEDSLFLDANGLFPTFSAKIGGAYFLKIIGPDARRELDLIRSIRNQAAHDMNLISFETTQEISSRCRELRFVRDSVVGPEPTELRRRFLVVAAFFATNLMMRSGEQDVEIHEAFARTAPSLNR